MCYFCKGFHVQNPVLFPEGEPLQNENLFATNLVFLKEWIMLLILHFHNKNLNIISIGIHCQTLRFHAEANWL